MKKLIALIAVLLTASALYAALGNDNNAEQIKVAPAQTPTLTSYSVENFNKGAQITFKTDFQDKKIIAPQTKEIGTFDASQKTAFSFERDNKTIDLTLHKQGTRYDIQISGLIGETIDGVGTLRDNVSIQIDDDITYKEVAVDWAGNITFINVWVPKMICIHWSTLRNTRTCYGDLTGQQKGGHNA